MRILQVDNDTAFVRTMAKSAHGDGYVIDHVKTLGGARDAVQVVDYAGILVDRVLPDGDALNWIREQRRAGNTTPILIVTAKWSSVNDRVEGLNAGADDYIAKPVPLEELLARLRAVLRRPPLGLDPLLRVGNVAFDPAIREVSVNGQVLRIPRRETCILEMLIRRSGKTVTKGILEEGLYSFDDEVSSNAIEVGIYRLRGHLASANANVIIRTIRGVGYSLECSAEVADPAVPKTAMLAAWIAMALSCQGSEAAPALPVPQAFRHLEMVPEPETAAFAAALALTLTRSREVGRRA